MTTFLIGGLLSRRGRAALHPEGAAGHHLSPGGFLLGIKAFSAAVLGGIGNLRGALLGGLILGVMENYGQMVFGTQWRDVVAFVLLVLVLLIRPTGILGESLGKARVTPEQGSAGSLAAPGDRLRSWWSERTRVQKWGFRCPPRVRGDGAAADLHAVVPEHPGRELRRCDGLFAMIALVAIGLNVVVGQAGLLDLGYVGFYAVGAYTVALLTSPQSPWNQLGATGMFSKNWAWLSLRPAGDGLHRAGRSDPRLSDAAAARGLSGDRHARLRRDHPVAGRQPQRRHQRIAPGLGASPTRGWARTGCPAGSSRGQRDGQPELRNLVVLAGSGVGRRGGTSVVGNLERSRGSGAPGSPSGRTRRRGDDGRQHVQVQAVGLCHGSSDRRAVRRCTPARSSSCAPTNFNIINSMLFLSAVVLGGQGNKLGVIFGAFVIVTCRTDCSECTCSG